METISLIVILLALSLYNAAAYLRADAKFTSAKRMNDETKALAHRIRLRGYNA